MSEMIGTVVRVVGPIIDVSFAEGELPPLFSVVSVQADIASIGSRSSMVFVCMAGCLCL